MIRKSAERQAENPKAVFRHLGVLRRVIMTLAADQKTYKTSSINNRRYLGNKHKLLPFITGVVEKECRDIQSVADIFAGTGAVASAFPDKRIITNDIMYSNYICNLAWFGSETYDAQNVIEAIEDYNQAVPEGSNYMAENFADTYFSLQDCIRIGWIREDIEKRYRAGRVNQRERAILIAALLYAMDRIARTCGHYDAYRKGAEFKASLELSVPLVRVDNCPANQCFNMDANQLVRQIQADLVYIDPPYNSRQYCDSYHLLENVARWEKPQVYGVAKKMNRDHLKSLYCTQKAAEAFEDLVEHIDARYILFSYNNMAVKGNDRSNAKISDEDILRILEARGEVKVFSEEYRAFSAGKSHISDHAERLFLCICQKGGV